MSHSSLVLLVLCVACGLASVSADLSGSWELAAKVAASVFGLMLVGSLLIGKRIKFDPILR